MPKKTRSASNVSMQSYSMKWIFSSGLSKKSFLLKPKTNLHVFLVALQIGGVTHYFLAAIQTTNSLNFNSDLSRILTPPRLQDFTSVSIHAFK